MTFSHKGFTLLEVIIATGVAAIVGSLILGILVNSTGVYYQQSAKIEQGVDLNNALANIQKSITNAAAIASSYPETGTPLYTTGNDQLVIKVSSVDSSNNIIANSYDYFVYTVNAGQLHLIIYPDPKSSRQLRDQILALNVSNISFGYLDSADSPVGINAATKVKVTLTVQQKAGSNYRQSIATTEATLKNI